jgi:hypothetical protein
MIKTRGRAYTSLQTGLTGKAPRVDCRTREALLVFALNDAQLALVMTAAGSLPVAKRSVFLERLAARLQLRGPHFTDADLGAAIQAALTGLIQSAA